MRAGYSFLIAEIVLASGCSVGDAAHPTVTMSVHRGDKWVACDDSEACGLVAGRDSVRISASYDGLTFDRDAWPSAPSLVLRLDGVTVQDSPAMSSIAGEDPAVPTFESGPYRLPGRASATLSLRVEGAAGYFTELGGFRVTPSEPTDPLVARVTGCGMEACTMFEAGLGAAHVEVDSWLDPGANITLRSFLDDVPNTNAENAFAGSLSLKRRAVFDLPVPRVSVSANTTRKWRLEFAADGVDIPPSELRISPQTLPDITVSGCGEVGCKEFEAGVGTAAVEVKSKVAAGSHVTLRSLVRGAAFGTSEQTFAEDANDTRVARFEVGVPGVFVEAGTTQDWRLELVSDDIALPDQNLHLIPPSFDARFVECEASPCILEPGSRLTLEATAPSNFSNRSLTARLLINDVPAPGTVEIDLDAVEGQRRYGYAAVTAPADPDNHLRAKVYYGNGYVETAEMYTPPLEDQ